MAIDYEPFSPRYRRDPYPTYRALREEDPVHWAGDAGVWCVSRYADVVSVLKQPDVFSSDAMRTVMMPRGFEQASAARKLAAITRFLWKARMNPLRGRGRVPSNLITEDPPRHDAMRAIVNRGFSPRRIAGWRARAEKIVRELSVPLRDGDSFDVVRDLAIPLPVTIIAEMLGVPPDDQADFKRWSDGIIAAATGSGRSEEFPREMFDCVAELYGYMKHIVRDRRARPRDDLISLLVADQNDADGVLEEPEVFQFVLLLLVAGNETTTNLIGNATRALLRHPEQLARVTRDSALVPALIEETLRWDPPIQYVFRSATRDTQIGDFPIAAGQLVCPLLAAANRDDARFPDADRFEIGRDTRGHLAFGFGVHFCLGASLARLEASAALEALVPLLPRMQLLDEDPPLVDSFLVRGPSSLRLQRAA